MASKSKWIDDLAPDDSLSKAARHALRVRLRSVRRNLPKAARSGLDEADAVHRLRVSTRRAHAALECFDELIPRKSRRWMLKQLKRIRQAAGDARDYDVLAQRLAEQGNQDGGPWQVLIARLDECRIDARKPIRQLWQRLERRHFRRHAKQLAGKVHWQKDCEAGDEPTFAVAARGRMRVVCDAFFTASAGGLTTVTELHEFRILGKQLRYAMELFHAAFPPPFRHELYPRVEEVQEKAGAVIDHATAIERIEQWAAEWTEPELIAPMNALLATERAAVETASHDFHQWWTAERSKDLMRQFDEALTAPPVERVA